MNAEFLPSQLLLSKSPGLTIPMSQQYWISFYSLFSFPFWCLVIWFSFLECLVILGAEHGAWKIVEYVDDLILL